MSDTSAFGFGKFVPGFDFLQNLSNNAAQAAPAAAAPGMGSWVAPTLSVEDIDKRIQELKAVQFWLEQNGTALKATIQALEVQKMTLTTLQGMNVSMADLAKAFTVKTPAAPFATQAAPEAAPFAQAPAPEPTPAPEPAAAQPPEAAKPAASESDAKDKPAVDPMAWWGSLTQQFQTIAASAMKDVAAEAAKVQAAAKKAAQTASPSAAKSAHKPPAKAPTKVPQKATAKAPVKSPVKSPLKSRSATTSAVKKSTLPKTKAPKASGKTTLRKATASKRTAP